MRATFAASLSVAAALLPFAAGHASAAVVITLNQVNGDAAPRTVTIYLDADKFRLTTDATDVIFRGDRDTVWVTRAKSKTYLELTPETMARTAAAMNDTMAAAREKLAALPEAQRKQIEAMMGAKGAALAATSPPPPTYEKAGDNRTVGAWSCTPYRVVAAAKASTEFCIAKLDDLGLSADDIKPFARFAAFAAKLRGAMAQWGGSSFSWDFDSMRKAVGFEGFPIESKTSFEGGKRVVVNTVQSIQHEDMPAGESRPPARL